MAKIVKKIKLQIPGGKATPAPPVGTVLGPAGVNIGDFVNKFNEQTKGMPGVIIPVDMTVYDDRTFTFVLKTPPTTVLIREAAGVEKGSTLPGREGAGTITLTQLEQIAKVKMPDLNANDLESAKLQVEGTARSMGITVAR